VTFVLTAVEF